MVFFPRDRFRAAAAGCLVLCALVLPSLTRAADPAWDALSSYNVVWDTPGPDSTGSMPLGNGDIGLNVWVEKNGDLLFYIGKTDTWGPLPGDTDPTKTEIGLLKVGRVRVSLSPAPRIEGGVFRQELDLQKAEVRVTMGAANAPVHLRVWVDANHPVIHVQAASPQPVGLKVSAESWRLDPSKTENVDVFAPGQKDRVAWYFRRPVDPVNKHIAVSTFGAAMFGPGLTAVNAQTLASAAPRTAWEVEVHPLTVPDATPDEWLARLGDRIALDAKTAPAAAEREHLAWWAAFWSRSWIYADGKDARTATRGYILQRFITACAGRGAFPIKFNGSIFTSDYPKKYLTGSKPLDEPANADFRRWGGAYWFQNTRLMYWPLLASGDYDLMPPIFTMYRGFLERNRAVVRKSYGHEGSYFAEYNKYWGYLGKVLPEDEPSHVKHYYFPVLELTAMALDYYDHTQDEKFLRETLLPVATLGVAFYDEHFKRDDAGKLLLSPVNSAETFWKAKNPMPDIAGLRSILPRLLRLPAAVVPAPERARWQKLLGEMPELPEGDKGGRTVLLPAQEFGEIRNSENPEMYAIFPFRLFGVGKPGLELARESFELRRIKYIYNWHPDAILAAMVGDADLARDYTVKMFSNKDEVLRFPAFWGFPNTHDYCPDEENGGNGMSAFQCMLLQADDGKIQLLPAWPKDWNVRFKLHAPQNTVIEGSFIGGKFTALTVTPASRQKDIVTVLGVPQKLP